MSRCLVFALLVLSLFEQTSATAQWSRLPDALRRRSETTSVVYNGKLYTFLGFSDGNLNVEPSAEVYDPATNTWNMLASIPDGKSVTHQGVVLIDDDVWHIGGRVGKNPGPVTSEVWIYNITTNSWRPGPQLLDPATGQPLAWAGGGAAFIGRTLYIFGGFVNTACGGDQDKYHLTLNVDSWLANPTRPAPWRNDRRPLPLKRNHFGTVVMGARIYAVGGQYGHDCGGGQDQPFVHMFNPANNTWTRLPNLPTVRSHIEGSVFAMDGRIYVLGGQASGGANTNLVTVFNPNANGGAGGWANDTSLTLPARYEGLSAKFINSSLYATHGGEGSSANTRNTAFARTVVRKPVYQLGFMGACSNASLRMGASGVVRSLLFSWEGVVDYSTTSDAKWLSVRTNSAGKVSSTGIELQLQINTAGLAPGGYVGRITASGSSGGVTYAPAVYCVNLTVTASGARVSVLPEHIFSGVQGRLGTSRKLVISNTGTEELTVTTLSFGGTHPQAFKLAQTPVFPLRVAAGQQAQFDLQFVPPTGLIGALSATLQLNSNDPTRPSVAVGLFGLSARGEQGNSEPPLDGVVKTLGYNINVGGTGLILSTAPTAIGDEILQPLFRKAGDGVVTMTPVARYSPDDLLPFGYYTFNHNNAVMNEVGVIARNQEQTLLPAMASGTTSFDPGSSVFGFYTGATTYAGQPTFTEDSRNTGPLPHSARIYPLKDRQGQPMANSYLVAFEPASNGDYQDYVFVVRNVAPAVRQTGGTLEAEDARLVGAAISTGNVGYSGTGFADYRNLSGDFVEWTFTRDASGPVSLAFRYANGQTSTKPCRLWVNGILVSSRVSFVSTGAWANWGVVSVIANMAAGTNTVRLEAFERVGPDVDYLAWSLPPAGALASAAASTRPTAYLPVGTPAEDLHADLSPNPATGTTRLRLRSGSDAPVQVSLFDGVGRLRQRYQTGSNLQGGIDLSLAGLAAGVYTVQVLQGGKAATVRLVVQPK